MKNKEKYDILSTYDIEKINAALGTSYANLGEVYCAQREAFGALTAAEQAADYAAAKKDLAAELV